MDDSIVILKSVWEEIVDTIGQIAPEAGGIIGEKDNRIVAYYYDVDGESLDNQYIPNVEKINHVIEGWSRCNIHFAGFIHSHPKDKEKLSYADVEYFLKLIKHNDINSMKALIFLPDSNSDLICYTLNRKGLIKKIQYVIED